MNSSRTRRSSLHAANARPRNSGPLSSTIASGNPRSLAIRSSTRRTRNPPSELSTSMAGHSRVQSSTTVNMRMTLPVPHTITDEIDRPTFVRPGGHRAVYPARPANPPSLPDPHRQAFLPIQPIHPLVIDHQPFPHQQRRQPAIPEPHSLGGQFFQLGSQRYIPLASACSIATCRSCQSQQPAGVPFAHLVLRLDMAHGCPKSRRRYQFFESTSFKARLSSVSSATTCFSFRFSSSNCLSRLASLLSIPPYFAFQR